MTSCTLVTLLTPIMLVTALAAADASKHACAGPGISVAPWGTVDGKDVHLWTMKNCNGMEAQITDYGTIVVALKVPDAKGGWVDVVLGRKSAADYVARTQYFGCTAGRCANRIAGGKFTLDGVESKLATNNGAHHLHGGAKGFDKVVWKGVAAMTEQGPSITFTYRSVDGEEGYPGNVDATVVYTITDANELKVDMLATTDKATPVNLAHHTYWNLAGQGSGSVLDHTLLLPASRYTPADATLIPTGEIKSVTGTPLDFTSEKRIGQDIGQLPPVKEDPGGYDHNFVLDRKIVKGSLWLSAVLRDPKSGRTMEIWSNQPGIQFYSGNFLDGVPGKEDAVYAKHAAICLETQVFPDAIHKQGVEGWPSVVLKPGETYEHHMVHAFTQSPAKP